MASFSIWDNQSHNQLAVADLHLFSSRKVCAHISSNVWLLVIILVHMLAASMNCQISVLRVCPHVTNSLASQQCACPSKLIRQVYFWILKITWSCFCNIIVLLWLTFCGLPAFVFGWCVKGNSQSMYQKTVIVWFLSYGIRQKKKEKMKRRQPASVAFRDRGQSVALWTRPYTAWAI